MQFRLNLNPTEVANLNEAIARITQFLNHPKSALLRIGSYQERVYQQAFDAEQDPATGNLWAPLSKATLKRKRNRKILVETIGRIPASLFFKANSDRSVAVGYGDKLAAIHHQGATIHRYPRSQYAYFNVSKSGSSRFTKQSKANFKQAVTIGEHTVVLPARPLIGYSSRDVQEWEDIFREETSKLWHS
jgi:phage gpG-like protein